MRFALGLAGSSSLDFLPRGLRVVLGLFVFCFLVVGALGVAASDGSRYPVISRQVDLVERRLHLIMQPLLLDCSYSGFDGGGLYREKREEMGIKLLRARRRATQ